MQITAARQRIASSPTPPPPPAREEGPTISDRFVASLSEGAAGFGTGAVTGAVGAHLGMAAVVRSIGAPWGGALTWVDPAVITVGAIAGAVVAGSAGAIHGAAKGEFSYDPRVSSAVGACVGAGAGAITFTALLNHATSGASFFGG